MAETCVPSWFDIAEEQETSLEPSPPAGSASAGAVGEASSREGGEVRAGGRAALRGIDQPGPVSGGRLPTVWTTVFQSATSPPTPPRPDPSPGAYGPRARSLGQIL